MADGSPVHCTIDLDATGRQVGRLELPRSTNTSGWSHLFIPIISISGGDGPTAVVFGGVHGDEPEGQIAALNLARATRPEQVHGRLIIVPCASPDASRGCRTAARKVFPLSPWRQPNGECVHRTLQSLPVLILQVLIQMR